MKDNEQIEDLIHQYYWQDDINCATTTLKILARKFNVSLNQQVINSALGRHGAGAYGAQCGLVEGTLMFLGILGRKHAISDRKIIELCQQFAAEFEGYFGSLLCGILRPEGFHSTNPPHLCEPLTCKAIRFSLDFTRSNLGKENEIIS